MKKRHWIGLIALVAVIVAAIVLIVCLRNPYNQTERDGWDVYASLNCFVRTEYNCDGNPIKRELYDMETYAEVLVQHYRYDRKGVLSDFRVDGKSLDDTYYQGARFSLTYHKEENTHGAKPIAGNGEYDSVSIAWTDDGKLESEYAKWIVGTNFTYDKAGCVVSEYDHNSGKEWEHRLSEDKQSILVTEEGSLSEIMTVTFGENDLPLRVTNKKNAVAYTLDYTYTEENRCSKIGISMYGQTISEVVISYDEKGDPIKREVTAKQNDTTVVAALYEYTYDNDHNLTWEKLSEADDESLSLIVQSEAKYGYDKKGNMIEKKVGSFTNAGNFLRWECWAYAYDKAGNKIESNYTETNFEGTLVKEKYATRYYADGTKRGSTIYEFYANQSTKEIVDTEYTKDGYVLRKETLEYRKGENVDGVVVDGTLSSKSLFESTKDGVPLKRVDEAYREDGSCSSKTDIQYYQKGKAKVEYRYYIKPDNTLAKGDSYITCTTKTSVKTTYYQSGQISTQTTKVYLEDGTLKKNDEVHYDESGNVISRG